MTARDSVADGLALAMLAGPWTPAATRSRALIALGRTRAPKWLVELVEQVHAAYRDAPADRPRELAGYLQACPAWAKAWQHRRPPRMVVWTAEPTRIVRRRWPVAELHDHAALAALLDVDQGELAWFADVRAQARQLPPRLQHYRWTAFPRPDGVRLVAAPKPRLKEIQRRLLRHVLQPIALHDAAHGGVRGRSVRTAVAPHAGADVVVRVDLEAFFASIPAGRIWNLLTVAGLPESVAYTLTGLMTTVAPDAVVSANAARLDRPAARGCGSPTCRPGPRPHPRWPTCSATPSTGGSPALPSGSARTTRATSTTWPSAAVRSCDHAAAASCTWSRRSPAPRDSRSTRANRAC